MTTKAKAAPAAQDTPKRINLGEQLSKAADIAELEFWIIGTSPLIVHAWSHKAKQEMLSKQVKATRAGRAVRDPEGDFRASLYEMGDGAYGFPAMGIKNALISVAHKDKGVVKGAVVAGLYMHADMVSVRPALAGAVCDMPLLRIWGTPPEMREDMVRVGSGLNKTATLAYRGQFRTWAMKVEGKLNTSILPVDQLVFLVREAGMASGIGEWRVEKHGTFGSFRLANAEEASLWEDFRNGVGPLPAERTGRPALMAAE